MSSKAFGSRHISDSFSLRNVNLSIESGEIVGFVGANGAGKPMRP